MKSPQGSQIKIVGCLGIFPYLKRKNNLLFFENGFRGAGFNVGKVFVTGFADISLRLAGLHF